MTPHWACPDTVDGAEVGLGWSDPRARGTEGVLADS